MLKSLFNENWIWEQSKKWEQSKNLFKNVKHLISNEKTGIRSLLFRNLRVKFRLYLLQ